MEPKHSGFGTASFILACVMTVCLVALVVAIGILATSTPGEVNGESPIAVALGLGILGTLAVEVFAVGLGVAGLLQRDRKKVFAVLGLIISSITVLGVLSLLVMGLVMEQ